MELLKAFLGLLPFISFVFVAGLFLACLLTLSVNGIIYLITKDKSKLLNVVKFSFYISLIITVCYSYVILSYDGPIYL